MGIGSKGLNHADIDLFDASDVIREKNIKVVPVEGHKGIYRTDRPVNGLIAYLLGGSASDSAEKDGYVDFKLEEKAGKNGYGEKPNVKHYFYYKAIKKGDLK